MADSASSAFDPTRATIVLQSGRTINLDPQVQTPTTLEAATRPLMLQHIPETFHDAMKKDGKGLTGERAAIAWEVFQDRMMQGESEAQALSTTRKLFGLEKMDAQTLSTLQETGALVTRPDTPELMAPITAEEAKAAAAQVGKPQALPTGPKITSIEMLDVVLIQNDKTLDDILKKQEELGNHQREEIEYELENGAFFSLGADGTLTLFHADGKTPNLTRFTPLNINELNQPIPESHMINVENNLLAQMGFASAPTPGSQFGTLDDTQREEAISNFRKKIGLEQTGAMEQRTRDALKTYADQIAEDGNTEKAIEMARKAAGLDAGNQQKPKVSPPTQTVPPAIPTPAMDPANLPPGSVLSGQGGFSAIGGFSDPYAPPGTHLSVEPFVADPNIKPPPSAPQIEEMNPNQKMQDALGPKGQRLTPEQMRGYTPPGQPREGASTGAPDPMIEALAKNGIQPGMTFSEIAASTMFQSQYSPVGNPREKPQNAKGIS